MRQLKELEIGQTFQFGELPKSKAWMECIIWMVVGSGVITTIDDTSNTLIKIGKLSDLIVYQCSIGNTI